MLETSLAGELIKTVEFKATIPIVNSYNEWDPLEEIIVGRIEGATVPSLKDKAVGTVVKAKDETSAKFFAEEGKHYPDSIAQKAQKEVDEFINILQGEGIVVRRPEEFDFSKPYETPYWRSSGFSASCPRDAFLVIGNEIIEAPMSWRCRYYETLPYKKLFNYYFEQGAKWTSAPKPALADSLFDNVEIPKDNSQKVQCVTNESEIVFDAADFVRFGKDIVVARSHTTNYKGIEWLSRHLGDQYKIHCIDVKSKCPMHLDTTIIPVGPGQLIVNPKYFSKDSLPKIFKSWDIFIAPEPEIIEGVTTTYFGSIWLSLNMLCIGPGRVIVEARQKKLIKQLNEWGIETIPCNFAHFEPYEGSFHCATLDIRRKGTLESYF